MAEERVQKILAAAGYGSRRACEKLIEDGRVKVNGNMIQLGDQADPTKDTITVDGKLMRKTIEKIYIALNKPKGYLSDIDLNHPRPTVNDLIGISDPLFAVGRLDMDSEGLILMTNDGKMANRLTHPRYEHEKEYEVFVIKQPDEEQLAIWRRGVIMEDGSRTLPAKIEVMNNANNGSWLRIILKEGKKRQIRKVGSRIGLPVGKIKRVRIGPLKLGKLRSGEWRYLTEFEIKKLLKYTKTEKEKNVKNA